MLLAFHTPTSTSFYSIIDLKHIFHDQIYIYSYIKCLNNVVNSFFLETILNTFTFAYLFRIHTLSNKPMISADA